MKESLQGKIIGASEFKENTNVCLMFELSNPTDQDYYVLKWQTPLEGKACNSFRVMRDGERLAYIGMLVKRGKPDPADYVLLPSDGSVTVEFDLTDGYPVTCHGEYSVELRTELRVFEAADFERFSDGEDSCRPAFCQLSGGRHEFRIFKAELSCNDS